MTSTNIPDRTEAPEYYFKYIALAPEHDVCAALATQLAEMRLFFRTIPEERSRDRYAPDKWSIREVLAHVNDAERLFSFRAFWFARGFTSPLPSFDQHVSARHAAADDRPWSSHVEEFCALREATLSLFRHLPADAWARRGIASDNEFTVRALAYIIAGHAVHHAMILRERYLL
jgi:hypothetical protein